MFNTQIKANERKIKFAKIGDSTVAKTGWTGGDCLSEELRNTCKGSRSCLDTEQYLAGNRNVRCRGSSSSCKCFPPQDEFIPCSKSDGTCGKWERCYFTDLGPNGADVSNRLCMACYNIDLAPFVRRRKIEPADNEPATCSRPPYGGLGGGNGSGEGDGSGSSASRPPDVSATPSYVAPPSITPFPKADASESGTVDSTITPGSSSGSGICIDAKLVEASGHQQVYRTHRVAEVFCDTNGSCATAGHIVVFNGKIMMMSKYCQLAVSGCKLRTMEVNSPQIGRNVRVKTHTEGLEMTALAARFSTTMEEEVLKTLVHFGA